MGNFESIPVTKHYKERYKQRIANSKRIEYFATAAYYTGDNLNELSDARMRKYIRRSTREHGCHYVMKLFKGFVHVFEPETKTAITVYRAPKF